MNGSIKKLIKNYSFSLSSNLISLVISTLIIAIVPKLINETGYNYFQLYIFYSSYIGFFHLGWCDGVYLKYGGAHYKDLDKKKISAQFWMLFWFEFIVTAVLFAFIYFMAPDADKGFVLMLSAFSIIIVIPKTMLTYVLQLSNRIKEYSVVTVVEKVIYCILVIAVLAFGVRDYRLLIIADIVGKLIAFFFAIFYCKDIVFSKTEPIRAALSEAFSNISIGVKLMVANVAGMLILGIVRLAIQNNWSLEVFGKVSLSISVSNMMMVFVSAIGIVLFPMLKRIDENRLGNIYANLRDCLMIPLLGLLVLFYPIKSVLSIWLPNYAESFRFMALLFPVCVFDSKMSMLVNTYMKAMRLENKLLFVNSITMGLSLIITWVTVYVMNSLELAVLSILILFAFRCILSEYYLSQVMNIKVKKDIFIEVLMVAAFVILTWFVSSWISFVGYLLCYVVYLFIKRKDVGSLLEKVKGTLAKGHKILMKG